MKKSILTIAAIGLLFTSCTKEDELQPVQPIEPVVISGSCLDTCGSIIAAEHDMTGGVNSIDSYLTLATSCDTVKVIRVHSLDTIYSLGMTVCFDRNELTK